MRFFTRSPPSAKPAKKHDQELRKFTGRSGPPTSGEEAQPDAVAARVAARQDGAISAAQLMAAGLSRAAVASRVERNWLRRVHRGVYLLGPVEGPWAREWAALLACGPRTVLSRGSARARFGVGRPPAA